MGFSEILLILIIAVILLGPERIPDLARKVGAVVREIKKATGEIKKAIDSIDQEIRADSLPPEDKEDK